MITSTFILKKTAASYDNRRTAILSVFVFADGGAGVGIHTTVRILGPVSGTAETGIRFPWIAYRLSAINNLLAPKPTPKLSSNPNPCSSKKTPIAYQSFHFLKLSNQTAHEIILCDTLYNRLCTNAVYSCPN